MEMNKTGTNKLAERILADARSAAEQTLSEANAAAKTISADNVQKLNAMRKDFEQKREAAVQSVLDGSRTRASIDGKKAALEKKRALIDSVFAKSYEALCALNEDQRGEICARLLAAEAEGGETVLPAKADRQQIAAILSTMNSVDLTLSDQDAPFDGGFLLVGRGYEKDCSFRAVLSALRDAEETAVANLLFD
ncbi:MAG: V-type ATP synthase subunit E [Candidatus Aphodomorpha sp.]|nr:hypothetical protein [bacterium]